MYAFIQTQVKGRPDYTLAYGYPQTRSQLNQNLTFICFFTVLAAPVLVAHSSSYDSIVVSWKAVFMSVGFFVSIMRSDGLGGMLKENTTNSSLTFSSLDPGTLYTIKVHAWDTNGIPGDDFTYNQRTSKRHNRKQNKYIVLMCRQI